MTFSEIVTIFNFIKNNFGFYDDTDRSFEDDLQTLLSKFDDSDGCWTDEREYIAQLCNEGTTEFGLIDMEHAFRDGFRCAMGKIIKAYCAECEKESGKCSLLESRKESECRTRQILNLLKKKGYEREMQ